MKVSLTAQPTKQKDGMIADDDPDSADQLRVRGFWPKGVEFKHRAKLSADARTIVKTAYDKWCAAMRELHNLYASSSSTLASFFLVHLVLYFRRTCTYQVKDTYV